MVQHAYQTDVPPLREILSMKTSNLVQHNDKVAVLDVHKVKFHHNQTHWTTMLEQDV